MKKRTALLLIASLLFAGSLSFSSCKKKDPEPAPTANTDNVDMGTNATTTIDVLANDSYKGSANLTVNTSEDYGTAVITSDKKVLFTPKTNFYGTATLSYTLSDDNGSSTGSLVIKVGTDAQIKTLAILKTYVPGQFLILYAVDGDTSRIYKPGYLGLEYLDLINFNGNKIIIHSQGVILKNIGNYTYSITSDGSVLTSANSDQSNILLTDFEYFTASAKKQDGSGFMDVSGFTFYYAGKKLDYSTKVE